MAATEPRIAVVMSVYKDIRFLDAAVDSILRQTFAAFEFIIVDDGSGHGDALAALAARDDRIRLLVNERNLGVAESRNRGIAASRAEIIAHIDADDLAEPRRLERQLRALDEDPVLGLVGSDVLVVAEDGTPHGRDRRPASDIDIRWTLLFHNPFCHSAVAFRRRCFEAAGGYRPGELISQDHYLWFDMLPHCRARNIPEQLAVYRINTQGLIATNAASGRGRTHAIREAGWRAIGLAYDLYDDAQAGAISSFLQGLDVAPGQRAWVHAKVLHVLEHFLGAIRTGPHADDAAAERLRATLVQRMRAAPPPETAGVALAGA